MLNLHARFPSRPSHRSRLLAGAATAAAVTLALPALGHAQSSVTGSVAGSLGSGSLGSAGSGALGSTGSGALGSADTGSLGSGAPDVQPAPLAPGPDVTVEPLLGGLSIPWDVVRDPEGIVVTGERGTGRIIAIHPDGTSSQVEVDLGRLFSGGESGLMGIALAHDFETSREVYTCHSLNFADNVPGDSRVTAWRATDDWSRLESPDVIVPGIARQDIGHHSGCRILAHPDGSLYIGTGDTFHGRIPQDLNSLGGKVLHVERDGTPAEDTVDGTPILTYGHRNVQGLALQPGTDRVFSAEHGTLRDDEINRLQPGRNYGWDPFRPGIPREHDDASPMTDLDKFPDAVEATWSSGDPTLATSGITFLDHPSWGEWDGALAVAMLKTKQIALMKLSEDGRSVTQVSTVIPGEHGRIRSLTAEPGGTLLATTSNGGGKDAVLRIRPVAQ